MAAAKNMRRQALATLREMTGYLRSMVGDWHAPPSLRWYADEPGGEAHWHNEPRLRKDIPAAEYQENDPAKLRELMQYMAAINQLSINVYTLAETRLAEIEAKRKD